MKEFSQVNHVPDITDNIIDKLKHLYNISSDQLQLCDKHIVGEDVVLNEKINELRRRAMKTHENIIHFASRFDVETDEHAHSLLCFWKQITGFLDDGDISADNVIAHNLICYYRDKDLRVKS